MCPRHKIGTERHKAGVHLRYPYSAKMRSLITGICMKLNSLDRDRTMKRSRFTEEQIIGVLREQEAGLLACCRFRGQAVKLIRPSFRTQPG
jgi:hypothetical protein